MPHKLASYFSRRIPIDHGKGCFLYDERGKEYLDCIAGWCVGSVGWGNEEIKKAIIAEAEFGRYVPAFLQFRGWEEFAKLLITISPNPKLARAIRCTSGSEAVEFAIKCARAATGKQDIVSIDGVYHGHTYGAAAVGEACLRKGSGIDPCPSGFLKLPLPHPLRGPSESVVITEFEKLVATKKTIAAFLSEPVWTNAGAIVPSPSFYPTIERICRKNNILFIMDEVATGFGHCGTLFASQLWGVKPDILCLGKAITGGYSTLAATLITQSIYLRTFRMPSYVTFGWVPLDLAAARANVEIIVRDRVWENAKYVGAYFLEKLQKFKDRKNVGDIRGVGLVLGIEIVKNKKNNAPHIVKALFLQNACARRGLLLEVADNTLFMTPSLIFTKELADAAVAILDRVL
ncbi:aspartate aminotransferase family protein [Candidatus Uhrbacteria bacterium]|nr:aspartate aminotransferase family protein [Candidatus Uhrbacteria bacterium]